jgi:hypothetical protein
MDMPRVNAIPIRRVAAAGAGLLFEIAVNRDDLRFGQIFNALNVFRRIG